MRLLIDGDACPDRQKVIELALHYGVEVLLFIDFAHVIEDERIQIIMCEVGKDSVDQMILSYLQEGDLLISQDYGLASLALLKNVTILHVSGKRITEDNINNLLTSRYLGHLSRKQHKHVKGPKKRNYKTSQFFLRELEKIFIENKINEEKAILEKTSSIALFLFSRISIVFKHTSTWIINITVFPFFIRHPEIFDPFSLLWEE